MDQEVAAPNLRVEVGPSLDRQEIFGERPAQLSSGWSRVPGSFDLEFKVSTRRPATRYADSNVQSLDTATLSESGEVLQGIGTIGIPDESIIRTAVGSSVRNPPIPPFEIPSYITASTKGLMSSETNQVGNTFESQPIPAEFEKYRTQSLSVYYDLPSSNLIIGYSGNLLMYPNSGIPVEVGINDIVIHFRRGEPQSGYME